MQDQFVQWPVPKKDYFRFGLDLDKNYMSDNTRKSFYMLDCQSWIKILNNKIQIKAMLKFE